MYEKKEGCCIAVGDISFPASHPRSFTEDVQWIVKALSLSQRVITVATRHKNSCKMTKRFPPLS